MKEIHSDEKCPKCGGGRTSKCTEMYAYCINEGYLSQPNQQDTLRHWGPPDFEIPQIEPKNYRLEMILGLPFSIVIGVLTGFLTLKIWAGIIAFFLASTIFNYVVGMEKKKKRENALKIQQRYSELKEKWLRKYYCHDCAIFFAQNGKEYEIIDTLPIVF